MVLAVQTSLKLSPKVIMLSLLIVPEIDKKLIKLVTKNIKTGSTIIGKNLMKYEDIILRRFIPAGSDKIENMKGTFFFRRHCLDSAREGYRFIGPACHCPHRRDQDH